MRVPDLGAEMPSRGNAFTRGLGRAALGLGGWGFEGSFPNEPRMVLIVAPHTSNWDFLVGLAAMFAVGLRASFLGKHTLFRAPFGGLMSWLGGIPVDRSVHADRVAGAVNAFSIRERLVLAIAPEGTRAKVDDWKTGFYHIAVGAAVPILPVRLDYSRRVIGVEPLFLPTGDADRDIALLQNLYRPEMARHPENFWAASG